MTQPTAAAISIKLVQTCFTSEHVPGLFKGESTHDSALRFVAQVVRHTQDEALILKFVASSLPENYLDMPATMEKNTLDEVPGMIRDAIKEGFHERSMKGGGNGSNDDPTPAEILLKIVRAMLETKTLTLFHDAYGRAFVSIREEGQCPVTCALSSTAAKTWMKGLYYRRTKAAITGTYFTAAIETVQAMAIFDHPEKPVFLRLAQHENTVVINLADKMGRVMVVDALGSRVAEESPVAFVKPPSMDALPLPDPQTGNVLKELQELWGVSDELFIQLLAFIINCYNPKGPYLFLLIEGEQGSGKTLLCHMLRMLIDPSHAPKLRFPKDERDLMILAKDNHLMIFDNISGMKGDMSDALCSLSSGTGFATRKLYSDDETQIFCECRPYILNGIADIANKPDLLERAVPVNLPSMPEGGRKTEEELLRRFHELRPRLLAKFCEIISCALRRQDQVQAPTSVRMADAAKWIVAAEPATGLPEGTLLRALQNSQSELMVERMENNTVAVALADILDRGFFLGGMSDLFQRMMDQRGLLPDRSFPKSVPQLSKTLKKLRLALKKAGVNIEDWRDNKGRKICVWREEHGSLDDIKRIHEERLKRIPY